MNSNFDFLEDINGNIARESATAEKLFRDEYFEQCITQTRKIAEMLTKTILKGYIEQEDTFDNMLYKLKNLSKNTMREQEFISDMYFLKKNGNLTTHGQSINNIEEVALQCLEHLFEATINFAYTKTNNDELNKLIFDEKLLMLGEKNTNLKAQYRKKFEEEEEKYNDEQEFLEDITDRRKENINNKKKNLKIKEKNRDYKKQRTVENQSTEITFKKRTLFSKIMTIIMIFCFSIFAILYIMSIYVKSQTKKEHLKIEKVKDTKVEQKVHLQSTDKYKMTKNFSI
jgi:hypothetical protein